MELIVLGMHRSGTSVLTHLLACMGCHVGAAESLQPGDAANPQGYWESRAAWALDEEVLAALGASWWEVADLDLAALPPEERQRFAARAAAVVAELDAHRPWALKEPRLCVLLPLWRPALVAPVFVFVHRDPLEVARSLQARDGFPIAVGLALWEVYTLAALRHSLGAPRVAVAYRALVSEPARVAAEILTRLEPFAAGALRVPSAAELAEVVRPDLHRQRAAAGDAAGYLSASQRALLAALEDGSALQWSEVPAPSPGALELLRWFAGAEREGRALRQRAVTAEGEAAWRVDRDAELVRWNTDLRSALSKAEPELLRLQQRVAEVSRYNEELAPRLAEAEAELGRLRQRDGEISQWNDALTARLAAADDERSAAFAALEAQVAHLQGDAATQQRLAEERKREATELRAGLQRTTAGLDEARHHFAEMHLLLEDTIAYAERCWQQAVALDRLVEVVLRSQTWRLGSALTAPLRWRRGGRSAEEHHDEARAEAEALAEQRRIIASRASHWSGGLGVPAPGKEPEE